MKKKLSNLLKKLNQAYLISDNRNNDYCKKNNRKWGYELLQSSLKTKQPMIIGFNWGVDNTWDEYINGNEYDSQSIISKDNILDIYKGSIQRSINMIDQYFPTINLSQGTHSNFCFFRSEKENQISEKDILLCIPIFNELISIIDPSIVFCFSSKARDYMTENNLVTNISKKLCRNKDRKGNSYHSVKGKLNNGSSIFYLPHPNYRLQTKVREQAWTFCSTGFSK